MTHRDFYKIANDLELKISHADAAGRLVLQPELNRVLECLKAEGQPVPLRLRRLNTVLHDEAVEARFDNMPV